MPRTTTAQPQPTMCLHHGDFHIMSPDCWGAALDWQLAHPHLDGPEGRDAYQAAVERKMLDDLVKELAR